MRDVYVPKLTVQRYKDLLRLRRGILNGHYGPLYVVPKRQLLLMGLHPDDAAAWKEALELAEKAAPDESGDICTEETSVRACLRQKWHC